VKVNGRLVAAIVVAAAVLAAVAVGASSTHSRGRTDAAAAPAGTTATTAATGTTAAPPTTAVHRTVAAFTRATATADRSAPNGGVPCPWLNSALPVTTRVDELLAAMTPLQEATLLHLLQYDPSVGYEGYTPAIPQLCIPLITEQDGPAGVAAAFTGATQLPAPIADAAAFDPGLAESYGDVIGSEDAAKGVDMALAPTINIDRSPRWGRSYESLGEDPFLTASLAIPLVRGIQANRVVAVVRHFAVYNQETERGTSADDAIVSERALREIYLPAFSATVQQADPAAVMCSYNLINGTPACQDPSLIDTILRQEWHFTGFVRSDCGSVYQQAPAMAVGISQVKCTSLYDPSTLAIQVDDGQLSRATLDGLARPLLTVLFEYNLIAAPHPASVADRSTVVTDEAHQQVALLTEDEGTVLLKNQDRLLPLDPRLVSSIALIGPDGGDPMPTGLGSTAVVGYQPLTPLVALGAVFGDRLRYASGADVADAVAAAKASHVAIVVVNDVESEGYDRPSLALPGDQDDLVDAVAAANPNTIVVLQTGSAVLMPWVNQVPAILETWYPGVLAGTSLVDILLGKVDPSGKLPVTFPVSEAEMPDNTPATFGGSGGRTLYSDGIDVGYRWYEANEVTPLFSFGYGMSYTSFSFTHLRVSALGDDVDVAASITNTGPVAGADIVQVYVGDPPSAGEPPRQLRAFQRVDLLPGDSQTLNVTLPAGDFAVWDDASASWQVEGGIYGLYVGDGSDAGNLPLVNSVTLPSEDLGVNSGLVV